jgi:hypothetical protein
MPRPPPNQYSGAKAELHLFSNWRRIVDTERDDPRAESVLGVGICLRYLGSAFQASVFLATLWKALRQAFLA